MLDPLWSILSANKAVFFFAQPLGGLHLAVGIRLALKLSRAAHNQSIGGHRHVDTRLKPGHRSLRGDRIRPAIV